MRLKTTQRYLRRIENLATLCSSCPPQTNGLVQATNKQILQALQKRIAMSNGDWVEELPRVLWS